MSDFGPDGLFDGLDDPTPPAFGGELLTGVMQRGQHLRNQRRMGYAVGSACVAVLIAGAGIGLAGGSGNSTPATPLHPMPSVSHTKQPHHHHPRSPGAAVGGNHPGSRGGHQPKQSCVTPTPTATPTPTSTEATPSETPTPPESIEPTPLFTDSQDDETTTLPPPTSASTDCATPTSSSTATPAGSDSPTPTYSIPPLLSERHPRIEISRGSS